MKNYTDHLHLETLHQQAHQYALLETTRNQDQSNLHQSLNVIIKIAKHWTIGLEAPRVTRHA